MKVKFAAKARIRLHTSAIEKPCNLPVKACQIRAKHNKVWEGAYVMVCNGMCCISLISLQFVICYFAACTR